MVECALTRPRDFWLGAFAAVTIGCNSSASSPNSGDSAAGTLGGILATTSSAGSFGNAQGNGGSTNFGSSSAIGAGGIVDSRVASGGSLAVTTTSRGGTVGTGTAGGARPVAGGANRGGGPGIAGDGSGGRAAGASATGGGKAIGGNTTGGNSGGRTSSGGSSMGGKAINGGATTAAGTTAGHAGTGGCLDGPAVVVPAGYKLVWADEFSVDGPPDSSNWGYETGFVRNEEAEWYQSDNAWVESGCLIIEGRRERKANPNYQAGSSDWKTNRQNAEYTSSSLRTMGKQKWQFGRFEMRGRIKPQAGLWPAWWTLGVAKEWPSCGEIDIMEYYAGMIRANIACGTSTRWQAKWDGAAWEYATFEDKNWANVFHVWRMDWDDSKIDLLLDDKLVNTAKLSDMLNADGSSPFRQEHYMLINLAIGGNNGGDPSKTAFPTRYEVDYVRVFQKL